MLHRNNRFARTILPPDSTLAMPADEICRRIVRHKTFQRTALPY
jgi:hypothetical protein